MVVTNPVDSDIAPEVMAVALPEPAELDPELRVTGGRETVVAGPVTAEIAAKKRKRELVLIVPRRRSSACNSRTATPKSAQRVCRTRTAVGTSLGAQLSSVRQ